MAEVKSLSTDPRSRTSVDAVERALSWYAQTLSRAPGAPFGAERAEELAAALHEGKPCDVDLFDHLITLGRLMHRMSGRTGVPPCNVADVLVAVDRLPPVGQAHPWERDFTVDDTTFEKLGFAATSQGIADAQQNNRDEWRSHAERCRSFIEAAADLSRGGGFVVVLGVGRAFDLPLASLAQTFDRLLLIDVDARTVEATAETLRGTSPRARIETRAMDLTSINRTMVSTLDELVQASTDRETVQASIESYVRSYRFGPLPLEADKADLVISSCVASQLAWPQRTYALSRLETLGPVVGEAERSWSRAWFEFELRVQQDHIRTCTDAGRVTVLVSDMANRLTALDESGLERPTGQKVFTLGVDSLLERIPQSLRAERHASWIWPRHRPGPSGQPGSWMEVEALVLHDRVKTIA